MYNLMVLMSPLISMKIYFMNCSIMMFMTNMIFLLFLWNISKCILLFSKSYMLFWNVYFNTMIIFFIISMVLLIMSNSWLMLFLGWELLGLTSFLLILYYNNWNSMSGSLLTIMTNRLGDMFFMLSLMFFTLFKPMFMLIIIMMMSMTKSAQFPFSSWLPAAMAAPTPVSSLVHSSTLVTAGIYVFFRFNLMLNVIMNKNMMFLFMMTMLMGSLSALTECDLKKLIAFSTLSQLGLIFLSFYSGINGLVFYHLLTHAIFKSILFVVAGFVIWSMCSQLLLSSYSLTVSFSCLTFLSIINMMGFVFSSGFMSKDMLIFSMSIYSILYCFFMLLIVSLTIFYSLRLLLSMNQSLIQIKNSIIFKASFIKMFYITTMLILGRTWLNNWIFNLNWPMMLKLLLMFLLLMVVFNSMKLQIFKNLNNLNVMLSKFMFVNLDKDSLNFLNFYIYSLQTKLTNVKIMLMMVIFLML